MKFYLKFLYLMAGFSLLVVRLLLASLGLLIVSAAPTADLVGSGIYF